MSDIQIKQPNLGVVGKAGWCLAYVTEVFGVPGKYPAAINAWEAAAHKHLNALPPADVSVPVWFSYNGPYGHVAASVPGKGIYTTSAQGDKVFGSVQALIAWMGEGFKYLGYSEDINGVRVAEVNIPQPSTAPTIAASFPTPKPVVATPDYDGHSITIQPGWGLSHAAEAAGWPDAGQPARWQAIAALNGSNDWQVFNENLKAGERIVVGKYETPVSQPAPALKPANTVYSKWEGPANFTTNKNPTHKWHLDFVNDAHAISAVDLPEGAPFVVYGKAQLTDGDRPVYLMTQEDFGNADQTGIPTTNTGINIVDLSAALVPAATTPVANSATPVSQPAADSEAETVPVTVKHWQDNINVYDTPAKDEISGNILVHDLEGKLTDQQLVKGQPITIAGDATVNGVKYGFTPTSLKNKTYYGVPSTSLKQLSANDEDNVLFAGLLDGLEMEGKKVIKATRANGLVSRFIKRK